MTQGGFDQPRLRKAHRIIGSRLVLRNAEVDDARFIWQLRRDPHRARHLSAVPDDPQAQVEWLQAYAQDDEQAYFMVTDANLGERLGTVRLYGSQGDAFSWGSWLLKPGVPAHFAIESALMVYHYARQLGFKSAYFTVRQDNTSVWRFHERFGARRVMAKAGQFEYALDADALACALQRYARYLPDGIAVESGENT